MYGESREDIVGLVHCGAVVLLRELLLTTPDADEKLRGLRAHKVLCDATDDIEGELEWQERIVQAHIVLAEPGNLPQYGWAEVADELESLAACQSDGGRAAEEIQATLQRLSDVNDTHQLGLSIDSIRASLLED